MFYKALGYVVWKAATWYLRRRYSGSPKKVGGGALVAAGIAGALAFAQKRLRGS